ncbi:MAG: TVP38/TMEM64 family protein [Planctomycetota bacterium]|jgi:uncharacterized membrane protein YdjX (TVP38/TMEM64 family)
MTEPEAPLAATAGEGPTDSSQRRLNRWIAGAVVVAVAGGLYAASRFVNVKGPFIAALGWIQGLGIWGNLVFGLVYVLACTLMVSGAVLTLGAGAIYGPVWGTVTVSIASTLGAMTAFLVGRTFGRNWVARKVEGNPRFHAIDEAIGREGFKIVLLTRLSPVFPFVLLNYMFGITKVSFWKCALASWVGMLPGTIMYVYLGSVVKSLADLDADKPKTPAEQVFFWAGLAVTVVVAVVVGRVAKKAIAEAAPGCVDGVGSECEPAVDTGSPGGSGQH